LQIALSLTGKVDSPRIVRITNTLKLDEIQVSEAIREPGKSLLFLDEIQAIPEAIQAA
jgi:MoxR-like ATPase